MLTLLAVDVVQEVDGIFDDAVADIAIVPAFKNNTIKKIKAELFLGSVYVPCSLSRWGGFGDYNTFAEFRFQVNLVFSLLEKFSFDGWVIIRFFVSIPFISHPLNSQFLVLISIPFPTMVFWSL